VLVPSRLFGKPLAFPRKDSNDLGNANRTAGFHSGIARKINPADADWEIGAPFFNVSLDSPCC
jgi:hypothetical protein